MNSLIVLCFFFGSPDQQYLIYSSWSDYSKSTEITSHLYFNTSVLEEITDLLLSNSTWFSIEFPLNGNYSLKSPKTSWQSA